MSGHLRMDGSSLVSLSLPKLESVQMLFIHDNGAMTDLDLPALMSVTGTIWPTVTTVEVVDNALLPQCQVDALIEQLTTLSGETETHGNDTEATCD